MARRFDLVLGLGSACSCTQTLRAAGLQFASYPLDWVYGGGIRERTALATGGFVGWMEKDDFVPAENAHAFGHDPYVNRRTGMSFPHEFAKGADFDVSFPLVREKYARRIARMESRIASAGSVLLVWIADPRDAARLADGDLADCLAAFRRRWPGTSFNLMALDREPGVRPAEMRRREGDGFVVLSFDYGDPKGEDFSVRPELLLPLFADVEAVDYRTPAERRAERRRREQARRERLNATSWWDGFVTGMQLRLYRHLAKRLERRGMRLGRPA